MRYTEFLLEYDRSREQARIEAMGAYQARQQQDPDFSLEQLESADPTAQKIYVPRLATWWLAGEPVEDLISTTADALVLYHLLKNKKQIRPEHADIGRFRTADQFTEFMASQNVKFRGKYTEIFRDSKLEVVQLLDKTAAVWWGQGTQWCTKDQNNNQYEDYAKQGPLYVIVDQVNNTRYQLWWDQTDAYRFQFMDVQDKRFNPTQLPFYHQLRLIFAPLHPHLMWQPNPTPAEQLQAAERDGRSIKWITNPTLQAQLAAVLKNSGAIQWISNPTPEVQLAAVEQDGGGAIKYIQNPSLQVQLAAVGQDGHAIEHIPNPSLQVQLAAVRRVPAVIRWIPTPTPEVQLAAVGRLGYVIYYINDPTPEVQLAAVEQDPDSIRHIKNPSLAAQLTAIERNGRVIKWIKNPTPEVQLAAVRQDPGAIYWIKNPTPEVQALAVKLRKNK